MMITKTKTLLFLLISLMLSLFCHAKEPFPTPAEMETNVSKEDIEKVSFYRGFLLYKQHLKKSDVPFDFNQILAGMREAYENENGIDFSEESLQASIERMQEFLLKKTQKERLEEANAFFADIRTEEGIVELVPEKLYYKVVQKGSGASVGKNDSPLLLYKVKTITKGQDDEIHQITEPKEILLRSTIAGFAQGVLGMQEGEKRILYIHPDLAYRSISEKMDPNTLLIFDVEVVKASNE